MTLGFDFHPEAQAEFDADIDWYDDREFGVGGRFADEVREAIGAACVSPETWTKWPEWDRDPALRSKVSRRSLTASCISFRTVASSSWRSPTPSVAQATGRTGSALAEPVVLHLVMDNYATHQHANVKTWRRAIDDSAFVEERQVEIVGEHDGSGERCLL